MGAISNWRNRNNRFFHPVLVLKKSNPGEFYEFNGSLYRKEGDSLAPVPPDRIAEIRREIYSANRGKERG